MSGIWNCAILHCSPCQNHLHSSLCYTPLQKSLPMATKLTKPRVVIVGAGVSGLTVGMCLQETYGQQLDITIVAEKFSPETTGDRAGGIFVAGGSYITAGDAHAFEEQAKRWLTATYRHFTELIASYGEEETGIRRVPFLRLLEMEIGTPWFKGLFPDFKELTKADLQALNVPSKKYRTMWSFTSFLIMGKKYLPWMMARFREKGGLIEQRKISSLSELDSYNIIINCAGLGARELVGDDSLYPVRGQIVAIKAPKDFSNRAYHTREYDLTNVAYVIPHKDFVLLGGSAEPGNFSTDPDPETTQEIFQKCVAIAPELKGAEIVDSWACLRPVRETVRVEVEDPSASPAVVHNYGHGGHGYILSWGCALDVVELVWQCLQRKGFAVKPVSKL